jgi:hypothetical protein
MRTALDSFSANHSRQRSARFDAFVNESTLKREKRTKKLAKEAKFAEKDSNECLCICYSVTAEEDLVLSIESSANTNYNQLIADLSAKFANKTIQKRLKLRIKTLKQNNCLFILSFVLKFE